MLPMTTKRIADILFGGLTTRTEEALEQLKVVGSVYFSDRGMSFSEKVTTLNRPINVHTDSLGWRLGLKPSVIALNLNNPLTEEQVNELFPSASVITNRDGSCVYGMAITHHRGEGVIREWVARPSIKGEGLFILDWRAMRLENQTALVEKALGLAAKRLNWNRHIIKQGVIPAHGGWMFDSGRERIPGIDLAPEDVDRLHLDSASLEIMRNVSSDMALFVAVYEKMVSRLHMEVNRRQPRESDEFITQVRILVPGTNSLSWEEFVRKYGISPTKSLLDLMRAGKDLWKAPEGPSIVSNIMVYPDRGANHDGNLFVRATTDDEDGTYGLVRGFCWIPMEGNRRSLGILKGRALRKRSLRGPDGEVLPENVHGWTFATNLKWEDVRFSNGKPVTLKVRIWDVKEESDEKERDAFKIHLAFHFMTSMSVIDDHHDSLNARFKKHIRKVADMLLHPDKAVLNGLFEGDSESVIADAIASRIVLGVHSDNDLHQYQYRVIQRLRSSRQLDTSYAAVIFCDEWEGTKLNPGEILLSAELVAAQNEKQLVNGPFGFIRWPIASRQSLAAVRAIDGVTNGMKGAFVVAHTSLGKYVQGDGDDHVLITWNLLPDFHPESGEDTIVRPPDGHLMSRRPLTPVRAYLKGEHMRMSVGRFANLLMKAVSFARENNLGRAVEDRCMANVGYALDLCVQGAKKNVQEPVYDEVKAEIDSTLGADWGPTRMGILSTDKRLEVEDAAELTRALFGEDLPMSVSSLGDGTPGISFGLAAEERELIKRLVGESDHGPRWNRMVVLELARHVGLAGKEEEIPAVATKLAGLDEESWDSVADAIANMARLYSALFYTLFNRVKSGKEGRNRLISMYASVVVMMTEVEKRADGGETT